MRKFGQIFRFLIPVIALVALVVFMTGAGRRRRAAEEKKAKFDQFVQEAWNTGNPDLLDEVFAPDVVYHNYPNADLEGLEAYKQRLTNCRGALPDLQVTILERFVEGDTIISHWTVRGTHTGEAWGPPSGKELTSTGCDIARWVDGKVVEIWNYEDKLAFMQQLGFKLVPPEE